MFAGAVARLAWIADQYRRIHTTEINAAACVTGKPVYAGGIDGRTEATGRGIQYCIEEFFRYEDDVKAAGLEGGLAGKRIIVQGLGNVGYHAAKFLQEESGALIVGIAEYNGGIYNEKGLNVQAVRDHMNASGSINGFAGAEALEDSSKLLEYPCDILIPAAADSAIHKDNADNIKARLIVEAANGPVTADADRILNADGKVIIPDMFANAGGVIVSYFEWVKNLSHITIGRLQYREEQARAQDLMSELTSKAGLNISKEFSESYVRGSREINLVRAALDDAMRTAYQAMREHWHGNKDVKDLRTAAYIVAINRVAQSYSALGL